MSEAKPAGTAVKEACKLLSGGKELQPEKAKAAMQEIMAGGATSAQIGAFLALLSLDKCTPGIIHALAETMRDAALPVALPRGPGEPLVDIVGTGGDGQDTFNISTTAGLLAAGAGVRIVKHGNRAATSKSGAADILEAMGAKLEVTPEEAGPVLSAASFVFLFAKAYHPAMKQVGPVRTEIGIRTVFNILGPLTNPARPDAMCCGVYSPVLGRPFAEVFKMLGMKRSLVVHGCEVLDELSIAGPSMVWELKADGEIAEYRVTAADFGLNAHPLSAVASGTPEENAVEILEVLAGRGREAVRDMVLMNAAACIYVAGKAPDFKSGVVAARAAMEDGRASRAAKAYLEASAKYK